MVSRVRGSVVSRRSCALGSLKVGWHFCDLSPPNPHEHCQEEGSRTRRWPHPPSFTLWEAYMASLISRGNWRVKLPQFFKTLLCPPKMSSREPPTRLFPLQFPNLQEANNSSPKKGGRTRFPLFQMASKFIYTTKIICWTVIKAPGNVQEVPYDNPCRQAHQVSEYSRFGKVLIDRGVQLLTSGCALSRLQDCEAWWCRSCWPLSWAPWRPSSTAPAPSSPLICTPRSGREHLRKSSS